MEKKIKSIPAPGHDHGPCRGSCLHVHCKVLRAVAGHHCLRCHRSVGYDTSFKAHLTPHGTSDGWVHVECASPLDEVIAEVVPSSSEAT